MSHEWNRRNFLYRSLVGVGGLALMDQLRAANPLASRAPHHPA